MRVQLCNTEAAIQAAMIVDGGSVSGAVIEIAGTPVSGSFLSAAVALPVGIPVVDTYLVVDDRTAHRSGIIQDLLRARGVFARCATTVAVFSAPAKPGNHALQTRVGCLVAAVLALVGAGLAADYHHPMLGISMALAAIIAAVPKPGDPEKTEYPWWYGTAVAAGAIALLFGAGFAGDARLFGTAAAMVVVVLVVAGRLLLHRRR